MADFSDTMSGDFLPLQIIYQGKTTKSLPSVEFPSDWDVTYAENHWSNDGNYPALVIFDCFN